MLDKKPKICYNLFRSLTQACVAQLVVHLIRNQKVVGSSPISSFIFIPKNMKIFINQTKNAWINHPGVKCYLFKLYLSNRITLSINLFSIFSNNSPSFSLDSLYGTNPPAIAL